ncbi:MAG: lamin tail domain-containing protein [Cytophagaceae bacterium]
MKTSYFIVCFLWYSGAFGQLQETFDDGNFTGNPVWGGDTSYFSVNQAGQLQSNGPSATSSIYLSTPSAKLENTCWEFYVRMDFNPSSTNYVRVYLASDNPNLKEPLNGYYVRVGGVTGSVDAIELYRQQGSTPSKLIAGAPGRAGKSRNTLRIKVIRDLAGNWTVFSDSTGGRNFTREGTAFDTTFTTSSYFGIICYHTATRNKGYILDDLIIKNAPLIISKIDIISDFKIQISLNNSIIPNTLKTSNISVNGQIPETIELPESKKIIVTLNNPLKTGNIHLSITDISDGEELTNLEEQFIFKQSAKPGNILITEIFADPTPSYGLPEEEFVEIFNNTGDSLNLHNYKFSDATSTALFPDITLPPFSYLILCPKNSDGQFRHFGPVAGLSPWPSLNNSGDILKLHNDKGELLHTIDYSVNWHSTSEKKEGGYSLEMINLNSTCNSSNWTSSTAEIGGTPGSSNSVLNHLTETTALISSLITTDHEIILSYNKELLPEKLTEAGFKIQPELELKNIEINANSISLTTSTIQKRTVYNLEITGLKDCDRQSIPANHHEFMLPEIADSLDLIINEVLFDPFPGGVDFLEIYNHSEKFIQLQGLKISNHTSSTTIKAEKIILPGQFIILTTNTNIVKNHYPGSKEENFIQLPSLPPMNNDKGYIAVINQLNKTLDALEYEDKLHNELLKKKEGYSLERVDFSAPTDSPYNWQSAAGQVRATPGYKNSQQQNFNSHDQVGVEPKAFSPDNDGYKDLAYVNYKFEHSGNFCSLLVFDPEGRKIKTIGQNIILGTEGFISWDGSTDNQTKAPVGIYIIFFEIFNISGQKQNWKLPVVVSK